MKPEDVDFISALVRDRSGIVLTREKAYLIENRLTPLAQKRGLKGVDDLVSSMRARRDDPLIRDIVDAMTTNESLFFRDLKPFDLLRDVVVPRLTTARAARKVLRIWSAACSSGQEPYSIAITLKEMAPKLSDWRIDIVATDISGAMLARARNGVYSQFEVQRGMPIRTLLKYFKQQGSEWQIDGGMRNMIDFREHNMLADPGMLGQFDIVFCRNVLIYFDQDTKRQVLDRIARVMPEDGVLFLGGTETVIGVTERFQPLAGHRGAYGLNAQDRKTQPRRLLAS